MLFMAPSRVTVPPTIEARRTSARGAGPKVPFSAPSPTPSVIRPRGRPPGPDTAGRTAPDRPSTTSLPRRHPSGSKAARQVTGRARRALVDRHHVSGTSPADAAAVDRPSRAEPGSPPADPVPGSSSPSMDVHRGRDRPGRSRKVDAPAAPPPIARTGQKVTPPALSRVDKRSGRYQRWVVTAKTAGPHRPVQKRRRAPVGG